MSRKKKVLTVDTNTLKLGESKTRSGEHYKESHIQHLVDSLKQFPVNHPEAIEIQEFYNAHDIPRQTYYDLVARWPELKAMHENVMHQIGGRLLKRSIDYKANWHPVKWILGNYSPEYAKIKEDEVMLAAKARETVNAAEGPAFVVLEKFPSSDMVPERKKNEE